VEEDVVEVKEEGVKAGDVVFDPESRVDEGVVLREGRGVDPDGEQSGPRAEEGVAGDVLGIVPDEAGGAEDREVGQEDEEENRGRTHEIRGGIAWGPTCGAGEGHLRELISHEPSPASRGRDSQNVVTE